MATLKISDLSVGDWVKYDDRICQIAEIYHLTYNIGSKKMTSTPRVTLYYEDDMPTYQESVILKDIRPIPITAEMLSYQVIYDDAKYEPVIAIDGMAYKDVCSDNSIVGWSGNLYTDVIDCIEWLINIEQFNIEYLE